MFTTKSLKLPSDVKVFIQDSTFNNSKLKLGQSSIQVLFQKDNSRICISLPKELSLLKKGSLLTLTLRNTQIPDSFECTGDSCPIRPISSLDSVLNSEVNNTLLSLLGTWTNIFSNILYGLSRGFHTNLLLSGVGFRAQKKDNNIEFKLGYSHLVNLPTDPDIKLDIFKNTSLHLHGCSKEQLGNFSARIKRLRLPDSYKGKGVRVRGENLRLKEGKKT